MSNYKSTLVQQFEESHRLEKEILEQLGNLSFNSQIGKE